MNIIYNFIVAQIYRYLLLIQTTVGNTFSQYVTELQTCDEIPTLQYTYTCVRKVPYLSSLVVNGPSKTISLTKFLLTFTDLTLLGFDSIQQENTICNRMLNS